MTFAGSQGLHQAVLPIVWILTGVSCVIVTARVVMKMCKAQKLIWEDHLMIVATALAVAFGVDTTLEYRYGLGLALAEISTSTQDLPNLAKYFYLDHAFGFLAPLFARVSFCLYMLRVLGVASIPRKMSIWTIIVLQLVVNITITILTLIQCGTFDALWQHGFSPAATCIRHDKARILALVAVALNAFTDLYLTALPIVVIGKIRAMNTRTKIGVIATLGLSLFASVASICKIYYVYVLYTDYVTMATFAQLVIVMAVEINVVVIVASLPVLAPLLFKSRTQGASYQTPVLQTYSISDEDSPDSDKSRPKRPSFFPRISFNKQDSAFASAHSKVEHQEEAAVHFAANTSHVKRTISVTVESVESDHDTTASALHGDHAIWQHTHGSNQPSSWEDQSLPPYLHGEEDSYPGDKC